MKTFQQFKEDMTSVQDTMKGFADTIVPQMKNFAKSKEVKDLKKNAMNMYGLYIRPKDIQQYIKDYTDYGIDYFGEDNECADDKIDRYWDEPEGNET